MNFASPNTNNNTNSNEECGPMTEGTPKSNHSMENLLSLEMGNLPNHEDQLRGSSKRLSRSELRRLRIQEALAKGEKVLSKAERRKAWQEKNLGHAKQLKTDGISQARAGEIAPVKGWTLQHQPEDFRNTWNRLNSQFRHVEPGTEERRASIWQGSEGTKRPIDEDAWQGSLKRQTESYAWQGFAGPSRSTESNSWQGSEGIMKSTESNAEETPMEMVAIRCLIPPDDKLTEEEGLKLKVELGRRALRSKDVRITSCHLESGVVMIGCANPSTMEWLKKQVEELTPFMGAKLKFEQGKLGRMVKVSTFIPKTVGADSEQDVISGLKHQCGFETGYWAVVDCKLTADGQFLVIRIDLDSLEKLKSFRMRPFLGCERISFELLEAKDYQEQ